MLFSIITPTTGNKLLKRLLLSLNNQEFPHDETPKIEHIVVIDGPEFQKSVRDILAEVEANPSFITRYVMEMPFNTGKGGFNGHKIYASVSQIIRGDYVLFLDEDNAYTVDHIQSLFNLLEGHRYEWVFTLRSILNNEGDVVCDDLCESLGHLHPVFYDNSSYLIDTNCHCIRKDVIIPCSPVWNKIGLNNVMDPDRMLTKYLMTHHHDYISTLRCTVLYQTSNRPNSVSSSLFLQGNRIMIGRYGIPRPWEREMIYVMDKDHDTTIKKIQDLQPRMRERYWLRNGFAEPMPSLSIVMTSDDVPSIVQHRKDLRIIPAEQANN